MRNVDDLSFYSAPAKQNAQDFVEVIRETVALCERELGEESKQMVSKLKKMIETVVSSVARDGGRRIVRLARSFVESVVLDIIVTIHPFDQDDVHRVLEGKGCKYLGSHLQQAILMAVIGAFKGQGFLTKHQIVEFVETELRVQLQQRLAMQPRPTASANFNRSIPSRTDISKVLQILYRAGCFDINKKNPLEMAPNDAGLTADPLACGTAMKLKPNYMDFTALHSLHDSIIVKWAYDESIYMSPDKWSTILYKSAREKSSMQSIVDRLKPPLPAWISALEKWTAMTHVHTECIKTVLPTLTRFADLPDSKDFVPEIEHVDLAVESVRLSVEALASAKRQRGSSLYVAPQTFPQTRSDPSSPKYNPERTSRNASSAGSHRSWPVAESLPSDFAPKEDYARQVQWLADTHEKFAFNPLIVANQAPVQQQLSRSRIPTGTIPSTLFHCSSGENKARFGPNMENSNALLRTVNQQRDFYAHPQVAAQRGASNTRSHVEMPGAKFRPLLGNAAANRSANQGFSWLPTPHNNSNNSAQYFTPTDAMGNPQLLNSNFQPGAPFVRQDFTSTAAAGALNAASNCSAETGRMFADEHDVSAFIDRLLLDGTAAQNAASMPQKSYWNSDPQTDGRV